MSTKSMMPSSHHILWCQGSLFSPCPEAASGVCSKRPDPQIVKVLLKLGSHGRSSVLYCSDSSSVPLTSPMGPPTPAPPNRSWIPAICPDWAWEGLTSRLPTLATENGGCCPQNSLSCRVIGTVGPTLPGGLFQSAHAGADSSAKSHLSQGDTPLAGLTTGMEVRPWTFWSE